MHAVNTHGAPKITMNSQEDDYQMRLKQARAQADGNPFVGGVQPEINTGEPMPDARFEKPQPEAQEQNDMASDALDRKLAMYRNAVGNSDDGNNDRQQTTRI
jgi:hypothetical protein